MPVIVGLVVVLGGAGCITGGGRRIVDGAQLSAQALAEAEAGVRRVQIARQVSVNAVRNAVALAQSAHAGMQEGLGSGLPERMVATRVASEEAARRLHGAAAQAATVASLSDEVRTLGADLGVAAQRLGGFERGDPGLAGLERDVRRMLARLSQQVLACEAVAEALKRDWLLITTPPMVAPAVETTVGSGP